MHAGMPSVKAVNTSALRSEHLRAKQTGSDGLESGFRNASLGKAHVGRREPGVSPGDEGGA